MKGTQPMIASGVSHQIPHVIEALTTGIAGWAVKYIGHSIRKEWQEVKAKLDELMTITKVQAENHLQTIQTNTSKTNDLLEKVVDNQIEMNAWLKGRASRG